MFKLNEIQKKFVELALKVFNKDTLTRGDIKTLVKKFCNQGFNIYNLKSKYLEFAKNKIPLWSRFGVDITEYKYMRYIFML